MLSALIRYSSDLSVKSTANVAFPNLPRAGCFLKVDSGHSGPWRRILRSNQEKAVVGRTYGAGEGSRDHKKEIKYLISPNRRGVLGFVGGMLALVQI